MKVDISEMLRDKTLLDMSAQLVEAKQQSVKQAEIIEKLKGFIKETSSVVNDWNQNNLVGEFLYEVEQLEAKYKGKE